MSRNRRPFTRACRILCSVLVAWPLCYFIVVTDGNAYLFLVLVLLAPLAGAVLAVNSLYCLVRYRRLEPARTGLVFLLIGVTGVVEAWCFLPLFKMH